MSNGQPPRLGILVSGGAPTLHLAAGALCAFHERKVHFEVLAASGAGALPALLFLVPKKRDPETALKCVVDVNIHDAIYDLIPSNFKVFFKYGPFAPLFWQLGQLIPHFPLDPKEQATNAPKRLFNDLIDLATAAITPTTLNYWSKSVLRRVQVVNELIDWDALPKLTDQYFFLNTFNLQTQDLHTFNKDEMTPEAFYAALAMPWLYPPTAAKVGGPLYTEGASHDPSGIEAALQEPDAPAQIRELEAIIVLDTIGSDLWVDPESLYEALELTIMDPIVTLSENIAALYAVEEWAYKIPERLPKSYRLPIEIPHWKRGQILEWSYSNAVTLWDTGYRAAQKFCDIGKGPRGPVDPDSLEGAGLRYIKTIERKGDTRERDFLSLFGDLNKPGGGP